MKLILGSASKWRKIILENAGYTFDVMTADIDEKAIRSNNYEELPLLIARAKAAAILPNLTNQAILITSDQVVVCNGELWEKPKDEEEAKKFLMAYSNGFPGQTNTAVVVINTENGKRAEGVDIAKAYFKEIPQTAMDEFIGGGDAFGCAGGFNIEHPALAPYIDHLEGDADSIDGLPMKLVEKLLKEVQ